MNHWVNRSATTLETAENGRPCADGRKTHEHGLQTAPPGGLAGCGGHRATLPTHFRPKLEWNARIRILGPCMVAPLNHARRSLIAAFRSAVSAVFNHVRLAGKLAGRGSLLSPARGPSHQCQPQTETPLVAMAKAARLAHQELQGSLQGIWLEGVEQPLVATAARWHYRQQGVKQLLPHAPTGVAGGSRRVHFPVRCHARPLRAALDGVALTLGRHCAMLRRCRCARLVADPPPTRPTVPAARAVPRSTPSSGPRC